MFCVYVVDLGLFKSYKILSRNVIVVDVNCIVPNDPPVGSGWIIGVGFALLLR